MKQLSSMILSTYWIENSSSTGSDGLEILKTNVEELMKKLTPEESVIKITRTIQTEWT